MTEVKGRDHFLPPMKTEPDKPQPRAKKAEKGQEQLFGIRQVAEMTGYHEKSIRRKILKGTVKTEKAPTKFGGDDATQYLIPASEVRRLKKEHDENPPSTSNKEIDALKAELGAMSERLGKVESLLATLVKKQPKSKKPAKTS